MNKIKKEIISICGGRNQETMEFNNPFEHNKVANYFIDLEKGVELKNSLNETVEFIRRYNTDVEYVADDPKELSGFGTPPYPMKSFSEINFDFATLIGALNTIALYELRVLQTENKFLNDIMEDVVTNSL